MPTTLEMEKQLLELQNSYISSLADRKDVAQLKAIKNNIKKLHTALLRRTDGRLA